MRAILLVSSLAAVALAEPAWPTTGTNLELTWTVQPSTAGGTHRGVVTLEAKLGATERTVPLGEVAGGLSPLDQPMCATARRERGAPPPLAYGKDEVGKLFFAGGVVHGYAVRRTKRDRLEIVAFDMGDERCGKPTCPPVQVATLEIPARVAIHEHIVLVDKAGKRTPFACTID